MPVVVVVAVCAVASFSVSVATAPFWSPFTATASVPVVAAGSVAAGAAVTTSVTCADCEENVGVLPWDGEKTTKPEYVPAASVLAAEPMPTLAVPPVWEFPDGDAVIHTADGCAVHETDWLGFTENVTKVLCGKSVARFPCCIVNTIDVGEIESAAAAGAGVGSGAGVGVGSGVGATTVNSIWLDVELPCAGNASHSFQNPSVVGSKVPVRDHVPLALVGGIGMPLKLVTHAWVPSG